VWEPNATLTTIQPIDQSDEFRNVSGLRSVRFLQLPYLARAVHPLRDPPGVVVLPG